MSDNPELKITSLSWREFSGKKSDIPYLIINCTFKVTPETYLWQTTKAESEEYVHSLTVDEPKKYEEWIMSEMGFGQFKYPGFGRAWTIQDQVWQYIEKFDTFWLREWTADCAVVRAALHELDYYRKNGCLPSVYRSTDEGTILRHLRTINSYWD
jgi:hypothetical protein